MELAPVPESEPSPSNLRSMTHSGTADPRHILVVDDEPHVARIIQHKLEGHPYVVEACHDGDGALERLARPDRPVDLVLLDIMLPGMGGLDVLSALRALPHHRQTPVIMLTAKGQDADRVRAGALGASDFLTKPFSPKKLLARIDDLFDT
jgi:DNA-binding response OmpR family regulator